MKDGKGKFFRELDLDSETKKLIRVYRKFKPVVLEEKSVESYLTKSSIKNKY